MNNSTENNNKKAVIIFIHGFKRKGFQEFGHFEKYASKRYDYEHVEVDYYDNHDKKSLSRKLWLDVQQDVIDQHKNKDIILVGFSMGGIMALTLAAKNKNVKKVYAMFPAFYINFLSWIYVLRDNIKKSRKMKKKLGKERWSRIKTLQERGLSEKYPIRLAHNMNVFRKEQIKNLSKLENKIIKIIYSEIDEVTQLKKTLKLLKKKISETKNDVEYKAINSHHATALESTRIDVFEDIISFVFDKN